MNRYQNKLRVVIELEPKVKKAFDLSCKDFGSSQFVGHRLLKIWLSLSLRERIALIHSLDKVTIDPTKL